MAKLILTQIVKNEAHVITRMLDSIKPIVDIICIVDTGSTDDTKEVIYKWGADNNIETHVYDRPFDNFEKSRNYSIEMGRKLVADRGDDWWGFWLDADEVLIIGPKFNKKNIRKDLYMFETHINNMKYTRNEMYKIDKKFRFYGPIHEYLVCDEPTTSGVLEGVSVLVRMDGGSWKEDVSKKYLSHAHKFESYIADDRKDPRWIFYTAQSWHDSANIPNNKPESEERLRRSLKYYKERVSRPDGYPEEIFYSQYRIGSIMHLLEYPWNVTLTELLKAYNFDPMRGESIKLIIEHYLATAEYHNAYLFSSFALKNFHNKNPYPKRLLFLDESIYSWNFLHLHSTACYFTGRYDECKQTFAELMKVFKSRPELFTPEDVAKIEHNNKFFNQ
jgi:glycosyltransferase involved in cell wall biosynthesis